MTEPNNNDHIIVDNGQKKADPVAPTPATQSTTPATSNPAVQHFHRHDPTPLFRSDDEVLSGMAAQAARIQNANPDYDPTKPSSFIGTNAPRVGSATPGTGALPASAYTTTNFSDLPEGSEKFLANPPIPVTELGQRRSNSERIIEREMERQRDLELEPRRRLRRNLIGAFATLAIAAVIWGGISTIAAVNAEKINYRDTYKAARDLKDNIVLIRNNYACNDVINYAENVYTAQKDFDSYADNCVAIGEDAIAAIEKLTSTEGYIRDENIQSEFKTFKESFDETILTGGEFEKTISIYRTWHKWLLAEHKLDGWDQSEADLKSAAKILLNSGQAIFAKYAEGWLTHRIAAATAYRNYYDASYLAENRSELREIMETTQQAHNDWDTLNRPNLQTEFPLEVTGTAKLYSKFNHLYELIKTQYQNNYVSGSGDCAESIGQVVCD